ncbi:hypothetical protein MKW98_020999 [Papaver atlanticum]|uniref:Uncharacterized protein n=1 Tax=Papaver atlanticum TaxID=357466 RepID=A0AAD4XI26_9MAGN|nr:hypothetical protein MKW98_020999 [Papaver atlanticum]
MMPLLGGFLAGAYVGRFYVVLISSTIYVLGLKPYDVAMNGSSTTTMCQHRSPKVCEVVFYIAIHMISTSTGGHKPSLESFGADQFDENHAQERKKKIGLILGVTMVGHIQQRISWAAGDIIITVVMITIAMHIYRFLDNAAIIEESNKEEIQKAASSISTQTKIHRNPWRLATVTSVEELKLLLNMIPIWLTTMTFGICKIGGGGFELPPASTYGLAAIGIILSTCVYDRILVPRLRRVTRNERGTNILPIGVGMTITMLAMVIVALVERKRLAIARSSSGKTLMSVFWTFWLAPQVLVFGIGDGFALVESMRSLGIAFYPCAWSCRFFHQYTDNLYWLLAGMNLILYTLLARKYIDNSHFCCILGLLCLLTKLSTSFWYIEKYTMTVALALVLVVQMYKHGGCIRRVDTDLHKHKLFFSKLCNKKFGEFVISTISYPIQRQQRRLQLLNKSRATDKSSSRLGNRR